MKLSRAKKRILQTETISAKIATRLLDYIQNIGNEILKLKFGGPNQSKNRKDTVAITAGTTTRASQGCEHQFW